MIGVLDALGRFARALLLALSARARPLSKKSQCFARLFRVLSRAPGRPGSVLRRRDAPGLDFGDRNVLIFESVFRCELSSSEEIGYGSELDKKQIGVEWLPLERLEEYRLLPRIIISFFNNHGFDCPTLYLGDAN